MLFINMNYQKEKKLIKHKLCVCVYFIGVHTSMQLCEWSDLVFCVITSWLWYV